MESGREFYRKPLIEIICEKSEKYEVEIVWKGNRFEEISVPKVVADNTKFEIKFGKLKLIEISDPQNSLQNVEKDPIHFQRFRPKITVIELFSPKCSRTI